MPIILYLQLKGLSHRDCLTPQEEIAQQSEGTWDSRTHPELDRGMAVGKETEGGPQRQILKLGRGTGEYCKFRTPVLISDIFSGFTKFVITGLLKNIRKCLMLLKIL